MQRPPHRYAAGSFGAFLQAHGYDSPRDLPELGRSVATKLCTAPNRVAPNSPTLEVIARHLKVPASEVVAFAKGKPMIPRMVLKIANQIKHGVKSGTAARKQKLEKLGEEAKQHFTARAEQRKADGLTRKTGTPRSKFAKWLWIKHQITIGDLAQKLDIPYGTMVRISTGEFAKNHPLIPKIAAQLHEDARRIATFAERPPLREDILRRVRGQVAAMRHKPKHYPSHKPKAKATEEPKPDPKPPLNGKAVVLHEEIVEAIELPPRNGNNGNRYGAYGPQNRLRKQEIALRQAARDLIITCNVAAMSDEPLTPPIPAAVLSLVMTDYLLRCNVKGTLLLDPIAFAKAFDPE